MTAKSKIIDFILKHGYIENHYCIDNRITTRLGAVIFVLRQEGWDFAGEEIGEHKNFRYTAIRFPEGLERVHGDSEIKNKSLFAKC